MPATRQVLGRGLPPSLRQMLDAVQERRARTAADRSLARRIGDAARVLPDSGVAVYVHDGAVSLYGTVASWEARNAWIAVVTRQPGVRRVVDSLRLADA